ncbi:MAG: hypothetical protein SPF64_03415 [Faecalibacterium longum]|nr:hypothetical protein [Faecalibacterium prausnitzii]MDY5549381.1 hypothetical protein [Faecalibacterium longum]
MDSTQTLAFISCIAALLSSIAALAAVVAQIVVASKNNAASHKLESSKILFSAKSEAYHAFLSAVSCYAFDPSVSNLMCLNNCNDYAILFSCEKTAGLLCELNLKLLTYKRTPSEEAKEAFTTVMYKAVEAMRQELISIKQA